MSSLGPPLQQIERTHVRHRDRKLSYFGGCDYFRLSSHPQVIEAAQSGLRRFGLNVAASRKTTGHHALYGELERELARFFAVASAVLFADGYMASLAAAQTLADEFTHALIDEGAHGCLRDAVKLMGCPVASFAHRDARAATQAARRWPRSAKILLLTDGLFAHSGEVAPLDEYLHLLPGNVRLLVDDAHGAGTLGRNGRGTAEHLGLPGAGFIQTITLSKAFGTYGGVILGPDWLGRKIIERSRLFAGHTPLPLPLAAAALQSLEIVRKDEAMRRRLVRNTAYVKSALRAAGRPVPDGPGPIVPIHTRNARERTTLQRRLTTARIHSPFINYLGGPEDGYFRFAISSEHTTEQLGGLVEALTVVKK